VENDNLTIDLCKPNFEFYIVNKRLNFNTLESLDTFLTNNKDLNNRILLNGNEKVKTERVDSVIHILQKHNRFRYLFLYKKGFWEK
jgi:biopolymer transport protein ExbD